VLFQSAAKVFPEVENASDHAVINSKGICQLHRMIPDFGDFST
jgi:hypothetical protein